MSLQRAQSQKDGAPAWLPGGPDRPINLAVFGSRTFFWFVGFCGCLLLSLGVGLHYGTDSGPEVRKGLGDAYEQRAASAYQRAPV